MTKIVVTVTKTTSPLADGVTFAATAISVTDNSGVALPDVSVNGSETPPWTATFTGAEGSGEATAVIQDLDTTGTAIGAPITLIETGTGGQPQTFQASTGGTITVS